MQHAASIACPAIYGAVDPFSRRVKQFHKRRKLSKAVQEHTQTQVHDAQGAKHMVNEVLQLIEGTGTSQAQIDLLFCILATWPEKASLSCR